MKKLFSFGLCIFVASTLFAQSARPDWSSVAEPEIKSVSLTEGNPNEISVTFTAATDNKTADKGYVEMQGPYGKPVKNTFGKTRRAEKHAEFSPEFSGRYSFTVYTQRNGESKEKSSKTVSFDFTLPLVKPTVSTLNIGGGDVEVKWDAITEADGYIVSYTDSTGKTLELAKTTSLNATIKALKPQTYSDITVFAVRGNERVGSNPIHKLIRAEKERVWTFTEFGTSTNAERNRYELLDPNDLKVTLYSCTFNPENGNIMEKGGKFESYFDGISFYYTVIDPKKENFELTATVNVDYHNPMADGQEGFGLLALDKLGVEGQPLMIAYNNSAGVITRKFTTHVNGVKKEIKNGIGARFVSGLTDEVIALGDEGIKARATSKSFAFSYDQSSDAIKTGDTYRVTLKKDNTGYHAIYKRAIPSEDTKEEFIMYDNENVKLLQLDKEHIYVGFAVARGCNATFSDVVLKITDPKNDPPAQEEPPELVPLATTIDCPTTWYNQKYPFAFTANANGTLRVETTDGKVLIKDEKITVPAGKKFVDFKKTIKINKDLTDLLVTFDPEDNWKPEPGAVIAQFNREINDYEKNYKSVTYSHSIISKTYKGASLYVSPNANAFGKGTKDEPLDLLSAVAYCQPGQTIIMLGGTYYPGKSIEIERGNDGTAKAGKSLIAEAGTRPVLDFSKSKAKVTALNLYGNYWTLRGFDITGTPGDVKALQVAGSYNKIIEVDTYLNGDTGIQISGRSSESYEKWPHDNLILGCESFGNSDPAQNNADGFASKLTSGDNNVFRNCVAHHNVDDGWDLYSKVETGAIGAVLIENCIAYGNGTKLDGTGKGDGNGFKLGGDGIGIKHILRNSVAWGNGLNGVTSNSNPALILDRVTSFGNVNYNISLYGKGKAAASPRTFQATGVLSVNGGSGDNFDSSNDPDLASKLAAENNYFFNGAKSLNSAGQEVTKEEIFVDSNIAKYANGYNADGSFNRIPRNAAGQFELGDLFKLTDKTPKNTGADYNYIYSNSNAK
ncbi:pectate lyase [Treponema pectinovorum]|uniref:pectate lyase n=1 Tax=Treponema pectinovorum TaxID=164 RepID=UPI0011F38321|nr:pectate lyase [Treponema pectinovorum]